MSKEQLLVELKAPGPRCSLDPRWQLESALEAGAARRMSTPGPPLKQHVGDYLKLQLVRVRGQVT